MADIKALQPLYPLQPECFVELCHAMLLGGLATVALLDGQHGIFLGHFQPYTALTDGVADQMDFALGLFFQRLSQCSGHFTIEDDDRRHGCTQIVLGEEGIQIGSGIILLCPLREKAFIPQVTAAANHHQIDAHQPAFSCNSHHIAIELAGVAGDKLLFLHPAQRLYLIAQFCRLFELQLRGGLFHAGGQAVDQFALPALQESHCALHIVTVILGRDMFDTGAGATLDLVEQTGA